MTTISKVFNCDNVFADPLRIRIRENAQMIAEVHRVAIEHVNKSHLRKEGIHIFRGK